MKCYDIDITGMTCEHCANTVTGAIQNLPGIATCAVGLTSKKAVVQFDESQASIQKVIEAVKTAGYAVEGFRPSDAPPAPLG